MPGPAEESKARAESKRGSRERKGPSGKCAISDRSEDHGGPRRTTGGASFSGDPRRPLSEEASQARGAGGEAGQEGRVAQGFCQGEGAGHAMDTGAGNETLLGSRNLRKTGKETEQRRTSKTG